MNVDAPLTLQVSHLFIVGGRKISTTPPGMVSLNAPRRPGRGREHDQFFAMITPYGEVRAGASFYEQLAAQCGAFYFKSTGSVTSGLREVVTAISGHLLEHNRIAGKVYQVSICCMVLRDRELYSARVGDVAILHRDSTEYLTYPDDLQLIFTGQALGEEPVTDIHLVRHEIKSGSTLTVIDSGFKNVARNALDTALQAESATQAAERLRPLAGSDAQTMILRFIAEMPDESEIDLDDEDAISEYEEFEPVSPSAAQSAPRSARSESQSVPPSTSQADSSTSDALPATGRVPFLSTIRLSLPAVNLSSIRIGRRPASTATTSESLADATKTPTSSKSTSESTAELKTAQPSVTPEPLPVETVTTEPLPPAKHPILGGVARALEGASRTATRIAERVVSNF